MARRLAGLFGRLANYVGKRKNVDGPSRLLADFASDAIVCIGFDGHARCVSPGFRTMIGWSSDDVLAGDHRDLVHPEDRSAVAQTAARLQAGESQVTCMFRCIHGDGSDVWVEGCFRIAPVQYGFGSAYAGRLRDITEHRRLAEQLAAARAELAQLSATDGLTKLSSRRHFDNALAAEWARGAREEQTLSLLLLDADHLKAYGDLYGRPAEDDVLRTIAACVHGGPCRTTDITARYQNESFAVLMPHTDGFGAMLMAEQVRDAVLDRNMAHSGSPHGVVSVSIGVATVIPSHDRDSATLIKWTDAALDTAKRQGGNRIEADEAVIVAAAAATGWISGSNNAVGKPR